MPCVDLVFSVWRTLGQRNGPQTERSDLHFEPGAQATVGYSWLRQEPLLRKASNVVQNVFFLYDVTGFTQIGHSIPVATNCTVRPTGGSLRMASFSKVRVPYTLCAQIYDICTAILSQFTTRHESSPRAQTRSNRIRALMASRERNLFIRKQTRA